MIPLGLFDLNSLLGRLAGLEGVRSVDEIRPSFAAPWARNGAWLFFACAAAAALAFLLYFRWQGKRRLVRWILASARAAVLAILILLLAEPVLTLKLTSSPKPLLWILLDGTESMAIADDLPAPEREKLARAAGLPDDPSGSRKVTRAEYVGALLRKDDKNIIERLEEKCRIQAFVFDRPDGARLVGAAGDGVDREAVARELKPVGPVTAIGAAIADIAARHATANLAGVLIASDFDGNAGPPAVAAARRLGVPVHTLGLGPEAAVDLRVDLRAPILMKKAERSTVSAVLHQTGLGSRTVRVRVVARRAGGADGDNSGETVIGERDATLEGEEEAVDFPFVPSDAGRFVIIAEAERVAGEAADANNRAEREVSILDDFLRLLYVEHEPTWEWRFIKEVFHRDKLVGLRGFRTFLRSADPKVRQSNSLFLPTLTPVRSEFFATDVIFLGDMPATALSGRFLEMTREFVGTFGGGLVVLAGPRFGPAALAGTPLADMLPVIVDPDLRVRSDREFRLRLAPNAALVDFMRLGADDGESAKAWANLGPLPWYQPVARLHPLATRLAEHPSDVCADGKTPQPLIAIRRYGRGEVVWLGFDETWRLRRKYGELYYRQFWGQMIHRLGLSHALGSQKRFVVRSDRREYQPDDTAAVTVEAYDANFEPLDPEKIPEGRLHAELVLPGRVAGEPTRAVPIPPLRPGVFEARIPVLVPGEHRLRVKDPVTGEDAEVAFSVTSLSAERRSVVRNVALEEELARATGGARWDLSSIDRLPDEIALTARTETTVRVIPLWNTWLCFGAVVALCLGEWLARKLVNLP